MPISPISRRPSHAAPHTSELAHEFSRILRDWLTEDEIEQVIERNAEVDDPAVCASHDFCDANMAMYEAFERVMGHPIDTRKKADVAMWDKAWNMAKASDFAVGRKKRMNPTGSSTPRGYRTSTGFDSYEYLIESSMLPALINGDTSGMDEDEISKLDAFEKRVRKHDHPEYGGGHWSILEDDAGFGRGAVTGLGSDRALVAYMVPKKRMNPGERTDRSAMLEAQWARLSAMRPAQRRAAVVGMSRDESLALAEWDATGEWHDPHSTATITQAHRQLLKQLNESEV